MSSLTLLATYDELVRCTNVLINGACEEEFLQFALNQEEMRQKWLASVQECQRLHSALDKAHNEITSLDRKLRHARRNLEEENRKRRAIEEQKDFLEKQIASAREFLFNDRGKSVNDETREKLQFLNNTSQNRQSNLHDVPIDKLNTIAELNSTGSLLSDLNCLSRSEDDLETSAILQSQKKREWKEHRPSSEYAKKHRRSTSHKTVELNSSDRIVATTTVVMPKDGTITASSTIEAIPGDENKDPQISLHNSRKRRKSSSEHKKSKLSHVDANEVPIDIAPSAPKAEILTSTSDSEDVFKPSPNIGGYTMNTKMFRSHHFVAKTTVLKQEKCTACEKKIRFGKIVQKCRDCRATAHIECKDLVPLPCVPMGNTPTLRGMPGTIADYTPITPPMVPSIVVHCINEIELRGMNEQGLYRVSGVTTDADCLIEKFLKCKGAPNLSNVDIATICSTLKKFLRSLREPLITVGLLGDFIRATQLTDKQDADAALYQAISELPQPNRDTLAFLMLHLQRVSSSTECKMPISNLATVFGPTLVGYSSQETSNAMLNETKHQFAIVESLLQIPSDYWATYVNPTNLNGISTPRTGELKHTPSTESLLKRSISRGFFNTPLTSSRTFGRRNKKYFATPPSRIG
ncbi:rac GTPase-activating protein 1 [Solenopsis invicta]|uniref:rac GTPase-activating protein 1 n=1 Tax=Solenopsis invicta TaxID=13686 RepID=UPI000E33F379|nr:rac GTPase-activating protein 1 [Solenopsis invicta]